MTTYFLKFKCRESKNTGQAIGMSGWRRACEAVEVLRSEISCRKQDPEDSKIKEELGGPAHSLAMA
jgi:hypothetical protein